VGAFGFFLAPSAAFWLLILLFRVRNSLTEQDMLKGYLIGALISLVAIFCLEIEPVLQILNEVANKGRLRGVNWCIVYGKGTLLSEEALRAGCVQSLQKRLYLPNLASGKAELTVEEGEVGWGGMLENKTPDHITTWMQIVVIIFDADGKKQEVFAETPIWIDPLGVSEIRVAIPDLKPEQFEALDVCEDDEETPKACFSWAITDVMGLSI
jgi:hypothetical protein